MYGVSNWELQVTGCFWKTKPTCAEPFAATVFTDKNKVSPIAIWNILALGADTIMLSHRVIANSTVLVQTFVFCWPNLRSVLRSYGLENDVRCDAQTWFQIQTSSDSRRRRKERWFGHGFAMSTHMCPREIFGSESKCLWHVGTFKSRLLVWFGSTSALKCLGVHLKLVQPVHIFWIRKTEMKMWPTAFPILFVVFDNFNSQQRLEMKPVCFKASSISADS